MQKVFSSFESMLWMPSKHVFHVAPWLVGHEVHDEEDSSYFLLEWVGLAQWEQSRRTQSMPPSLAPRCSQKIASRSDVNEGRVLCLRGPLPSPLNFLVDQRREKRVFILTEASLECYLYSGHSVCSHRNESTGPPGRWEHKLPIQSKR